MVIIMDVKKQSVAETWQALKTIDAYDQNSNKQRLYTNWNSFSTLSKTIESKTSNVLKAEDSSFILGTKRYQFTLGEMQNTVNFAPRAMLENQEVDKKEYQDINDKNVELSNEVQTQQSSLERLAMDFDEEGPKNDIPKLVFTTKDVPRPKDTQNIVSTCDVDLMMRINMDVNCLLDPSVDVRYKALLSIHYVLLGGYPGEVGDKVTCKSLFDCPERFTECVKEVVTKSLLRRVEDPSEKCRLLSISIITALLQTSPTTMVSLMSYILPVLIERLPIKSLPTQEDSFSQVEILIVENSEEVRLKLVQLLHSLLTFAQKKTKYFASEFASILTAAAMDNYHEILLEAFATMTLFGELCKKKLKPVAKQLISVVLRSLSHKRHRVRVAAVKAIHRLVLCGAHDSIYDLTAYRDPNLVPIKAFYQPCPKTQYLALLVSDKNIQVREQLLLTISSWLCELDERKEHECRLIPYMLTGFTDENPVIQDLAFDLMEKVGQQYEEENPNEVVDVQVYFPEDVDNFDENIQFLPRAFKSRPCLGARIMVRSCLSTILHALGGDLDAWTSGTKNMAAEFLYTLIMFVEENITMHLQALIVIMQKAFKDPLVEKQIAKCANVLGFFPEPEVYLKVILPMISGELTGDVSTRQLGANLKMLASIMHGSPCSRLTKHISEICSVLTTPDLLTSIQLEVNEGIVAIAQEMVGAWSKDECNQELVPLLWLLLNAAASSDFCGQPTLKVDILLEDLARRSGVACGGALVGIHGEAILNLLPHPLFWALRSLDVLVFCRLLQAIAFMELETTLPRYMSQPK